MTPRWPARQGCSDSDGAGRQRARQSCSAMRQHINICEAPAEVQTGSVLMLLLTDSALVC